MKKQEQAFWDEVVDAVGEKFDLVLDVVDAKYGYEEPKKQDDKLERFIQRLEKQ